MVFHVSFHRKLTTQSSEETASLIFLPLRIRDNSWKLPIPSVQHLHYIAPKKQVGILSFHPIVIQTFPVSKNCLALRYSKWRSYFRSILLWIFWVIVNEHVRAQRGIILQHTVTLSTQLYWWGKQCYPPPSYRTQYLCPIQIRLSGFPRFFQTSMVAHNELYSNILLNKSDHYASTIHAISFWANCVCK